MINKFTDQQIKAMTEMRLKIKWIKAFVECKQEKRPVELIFKVTQDTTSQLKLFK